MEKKKKDLVKRVKLHLSLNKETIQQLKQLKEETGIPVSQYLERLVKREFEKRKEKVGEVNG
jgi:hypothetical protein